MQVISIGGKIGVNCYVLITGFYLSKSEGTNVKSLIKLFMETTIFSIVIYWCLVFRGEEIIDKGSIIIYSIPIMYDVWWFASTYFVLVIISPILNSFINNSGEKILRKILISMTVMFYVIPTISFLIQIDSYFQANNLVLFIYLYVLGGYLNKYREEIVVKINWMLVLSFLVIIHIAAYMYCNLVGISWEQTTKLTNEMQSLPMLFISIALFCVFMSLPATYYRWINIIAKSTFGVYLIHDHPLMRYRIWEGMLKMSSHVGSKYLVPYSIFSITIVFVICWTVSFLYDMTLEKVIETVLGKSQSMLSRLQ